MDALAPATLVVRPPTRIFGPGQGKRLRQHLDAVFTQTQLLEIESCEQLGLTPAGRLADGSCLTTDALRQICGQLAPGLYTALMQLSGGYPPAKAYIPVSVPTAVQMYNAALGLRGDVVLAGQRLVRHLEAKRIDGLIGRRYQFFDNATFLEHIRDVLTNGPFPVQFYQGVLWGRQLWVVYRNPTPLFSLPFAEGEDVYYGGYWFSNSEISGGNRVAAGVCLYRGDLDIRAVGCPYRAPAVKHVGDDFKQRISGLFELVVEKARELPQLEGCLNTMRRQTLGYTGNAAADNEQRQRWAAKLVRGGVPLKLAREVVAHAAYFGAHDDLSRAPDVFTAAVVRQRTLYDLVTVLMYRAKELGPKSGERLERVAYNLITKSSQEKFS